jgi:hypothetical protein
MINKLLHFLNEMKVRKVFLLQSKSGRRFEQINNYFDVCNLFIFLSDVDKESIIYNLILQQTILFNQVFKIRFGANRVLAKFKLETQTKNVNMFLIEYFKSKIVFQNLVEKTHNFERIIFRKIKSFIAFNLFNLSRNGQGI